MKRSDEQIERIFQKLASDKTEQDPQIQDADSSMDLEVRRAKEALRLIERVRDNATDAANQETQHGQVTLPDSQIGQNNERQLPTHIGRFEISEQIGQGGFGLVFLARDPNLDRDVALKLPRPQAVLTPELRSRFVREGRAAAALAHPNIVPVFESGQAGDICYLASEFVDGITLGQWLDEQPGKVPQRLAAQIIGTLAEAISHAHQRGIIHRDIKPANILIENIDNKSLADRVRITDFGLAKNLDEQNEYTKSGAMVGTPAFMSPEQVEGSKTIGPQSDVYSLGAVFYQLLTGKLPFENSNIVEMLNAIRTREPTSIRKLNSTVSRDIEAICLKCLEKNPANRYQSGFELNADLRRWLQGEPISARRTGLLVRLARWYQRNTAVAVWITATMSALVAGLIGTFVMYKQSQDNLVEANRQTVMANAGLERTQRSIDRLLTDASTSLASIPQMDGLRKRMLQEALELNQEILEERDGRQGTAQNAIDSYVRMATIQNQLGNTEAATETIELGLQSYNDLPSDEQQTEDSTIAWARLMELYAVLQRNAGNDERSAEISDQMIQKLDALDSDNAIVLIRLANAHRQLGIAHLNKGELDSATRNLELSLQSLDRISQEGYSDVSRFSRAHCLNSLAIARKAEGRKAEAQELYEQVIEIVEGLKLEFPERVQYRKMLAIVSLNLGNLYFSLRDFDAAAASYQTSEDSFAELARDFPGQLLFHTKKIDANYGLAITFAKQGNMIESAVELENVIADRIDFEQQFDFQLSNADALASAYSSLGNKLVHLSRYQEARDSFRKGLSLRRDLIERYPQRLRQSMSLALEIGNLAGVEFYQGNFEEALKLHEQSRRQSFELMNENENKQQFFSNIAYQSVKIAMICCLQNEHEKAFEAIGVIVDLDPTSASQNLTAAEGVAAVIEDVILKDPEAEHLKSVELNLDEAEKQRLAEKYATVGRTYLDTAEDLGADLSIVMKKDWAKWLQRP